MFKCPVCGKFEFEHDNDFDVCEVCHWQNDGVQNDDPDYFGGANWMTLNKARANWEKHGKIMTEDDFRERREYKEAKYGKRTAPS